MACSFITIFHWSMYILTDRWRHVNCDNSLNDYFSHIMRKPVYAYTNDKGADEPTSLPSLISAFVVCYLDSIIPILTKLIISRLTSP